MLCEARTIVKQRTLPAFYRIEGFKGIHFLFASIMMETKINAKKHARKASTMVHPMSLFDITGSAKAFKCK